LNQTACPVVLVSNEVGTGIVPENRLARLFRDAAGMANQRVAQSADRVVWMVAGIPVHIKTP
jgi:adenosylcobinamide kinase / adenosylcobinamide-phosphate guanylyltransferase